MRLQREDGLLVHPRVEVLDDAVLGARREVVGVVRVPSDALDVGGERPVAHLVRVRVRARATVRLTLVFKVRVRVRLSER